MQVVIFKPYSPLKMSVEGPGFVCSIFMPGEQRNPPKNCSDMIETLILSMLSSYKCIKLKYSTEIQGSIF